jgi:hypothetical protein
MTDDADDDLAEWLGEWGLTAAEALNLGIKPPTKRLRLALLVAALGDDDELWSDSDDG